MIILIAGKMGAGKTAIADAMVEHWGFKKMSLAGELKRYVADEILKRPLDKGKDRPLLQKVGKEKREEDINYWCKLVDKQVDSAKEDIVIDDWRFPNEHKFFLNKYGEDKVMTIYIDAPLKLSMMRAIARDNTNESKYKKQMKDVSETSLNEYQFDVIINNSGMYPPKDLLRILGNECRKDTTV